MNVNLLDEKDSPVNLKKVRYVLAIAAGKGGVGKSTMAVNLALALKKRGYSVGVLDADIYGPSLAKMLPAEGALTSSSQDPEMLLPFSSHGLKAISLGYLRRNHEPMAVRAPIINSVILQFLFQIEWGELDYLLIDVPPGTGDIQLTLMQKAVLSGALVVTTPQEVALTDVRKAVHMFHQMNVPVIGIVENMSYFMEPISNIKYYPLGKGGGEKLSKEFGIPYLGEIPLDSQISTCGDEGRSFFDVAPDSAAAVSYEKISGQLIDNLYALETQEGHYLKQFEVIWENKDNGS